MLLVSLRVRRPVRAEAAVSAVSPGQRGHEVRRHLGRRCRGDDPRRQYRAPPVGVAPAPRRRVVVVSALSKVTDGLIRTARCARRGRCGKGCGARRRTARAAHHHRDGPDHGRASRRARERAARPVSRARRSGGLARGEAPRGARRARRDRRDRRAGEQPDRRRGVRGAGPAGGVGGCPEDSGDRRRAHGRRARHGRDVRRGLPRRSRR